MCGFEISSLEEFVIAAILWIQLTERNKEWLEGNKVVSCPINFIKTVVSIL